MIPVQAWSRIELTHNPPRAALLLRIRARSLARARALIRRGSGASRKSQGRKRPVKYAGNPAHMTTGCFQLYGNGSGSISARAYEPGHLSVRRPSADKYIGWGGRRRVSLYSGPNARAEASVPPSIYDGRLNYLDTNERTPDNARMS